MDEYTSHVTQREGVPHGLRGRQPWAAGFPVRVSMPKGLKRYYGQPHLHFITCSCYRRLLLLQRASARHLLVRILSEVRARYRCKVVGYVVMPEHLHLLISEPPGATPASLMRSLKQRTSRRLRGLSRTRSLHQMPLWPRGGHTGTLRSCWQRRFHDFNVFTEKKKNEKLHYMHNNPVKRGLVKRPQDWLWSSFNFYWKKGVVLLEMDRVCASLSVVTTFDPEPPTVAHPASRGAPPHTTHLWAS